MDQKFVSGLGNIYVNEILFFSGVNPKKKNTTPFRLKN
jgi:formamidopyrimidine-DNA glycosylase